MDKRIDKKVLEYLGIYRTKEPTQEKIDLAFKVKKELTKLTKFNIEKIYIMDEYAWGEKDDEPAFCFLIDARVKDLKESFLLVKEYAYKNNINILWWSMCQFEKRKNNPTELDYYIENYGNKIYDTEKLVDVNECVKTTMYASMVDSLEYISKYQENYTDSKMKCLLQVYALKINYPVNEKRNLEETIEYIKYISKDEDVLNAIKKITQENANKAEIFKELEEYIKNLTQIRPKMDLEDKPSMKIYERYLKIKDKGERISISNLTKENLYVMEVIQKIAPYNIAKLFDVEESEILKLRKKFGYKVMDSLWYESIPELVEKATKMDADRGYNILKRVGIFNFEKHLYDILLYMRDGEKYLLKEFWKLTEGEREGLEQSHASTAKDVYFRAYLCAELLKQNGIIEEIEYLTYRITAKGKKLLDRLPHRNKKEVDIKQIYKIIGNVKFFNLSIINVENNIYLTEKEQIKQELAEYGEIERNEDIIEVGFEEIKVKNVTNKKEKQETKRIKKDYNQINISKEKIGKDSERLIYNLEKERLIKENRIDLAQTVFWEAKENGDGAGYDIKSYEKKDGEYREIYIEVKGTNKSINEPFDISKNEIEASNKYKEQYFIYRVGNLYTNPKYYKINGRIEENFNLEATNFKARKK